MTAAFSYTTAGTVAETVTGGTGADVLSAGTTSTVADVLIGGAGNDTLTANAGLNTLTGGAGNDTFVIATASLNSSSYATITDFGTGDKLKMTGATAFSASKVTQADTAVFQDYVNAAMNASASSAVSWFQYLNNTYVVMDQASTNSTTFINGEDFVVRMTGLVDLSTASFNSTTGTIAL
jgi:S-layer protein